MSPGQAAALGLVQGLTEFLPVSSSAHLALFPWLLKWPDQGLAFDVALHWGTLAALLVYFRKDLLGFARAARSPEAREERRLLAGIVLATLPAVASGLLLEDAVESSFRKPERVAAMLALFGVLMGLADRWGRRARGLEALDWRLCLAIGAAQALAVIPGVSRSGVTMTTALALGLRRPDAARFSFLLAIPITAGAGLLKLKDLDLAAVGGPFLIGVAASAASGHAAVRFLLGYLERRGLAVFAVYRVAFAALVLFLVQAVPAHHDAKQLGLSPPPRPPESALSPDARRLRGRVVDLAERIGERSAVRGDGLARAREYLRAAFSELGYAPELQPYEGRFMRAVKDGAAFHNLIVRAGPPPGPAAPLWVIGAHYDTAYGTPGADDNASGVAVLLELARRLKERAPPVPVELVAYSTEEPPAFETANMGSRHHARRLKDSGVPVAGMISLEMLGYYDERPGSQLHPPFLKWAMPERGDFLALAANWRSRRFLRRVRAAWPEAAPPLAAKTLPELQAIRLSDHASYWDEGLPALLLTDTASYRSPHYHEPTDTPDTLDYERLAAIAAALERVLSAT